MKKHFSKALFFSIVLLSFVSCKTQPPVITKYENAPGATYYENDIRAFEHLDSTQTYNKDAILFAGSSSIRLWNNIAIDMLPYTVIQRGFGGARINDLAIYTPRIVYPHQFKAVVFFIANDITGSNDDKTPAEVVELFKYIVKTVRKKYPDIPIYWIETTPSNARWTVWPQIKEAMQGIKAYCEKGRNLYLIETHSYYMGSDGKPNDSLFMADKLHLNEQGYQLWGKLIKAKIDQTLAK